MQTTQKQVQYPSSGGANSIGDGGGLDTGAGGGLNIGAGGAGCGNGAGGGRGAGAGGGLKTGAGGAGGGNVAGGGRGAGAGGGLNIGAGGAGCGKGAGGGRGASLGGGRIGSKIFGSQSGHSGQIFNVGKSGCWLHCRVHSKACTQRCNLKSNKVGQAHHCSTAVVPTHCQKLSGLSDGKWKFLWAGSIQFIPHWPGCWGSGSFVQGGHQSGTSADGNWVFLHLGHEAGRWNWAKAATVKQLNIMSNPVFLERKCIEYSFSFIILSLGYTLIPFMVLLFNLKE